MFIFQFSVISRTFFILSWQTLQTSWFYSFYVREALLEWVSSVWYFLSASAGWGGEPCRVPVSGEPERSPAHGSDEETWWPTDRVSDVPNSRSSSVSSNKQQTSEWEVEEGHFSPQSFANVAQSLCVFSGGSITSPWWNGPPALNWLSTGWTEPRTTLFWHCARRRLECASRWNGQCLYALPVDVLHPSICFIVSCSVMVFDLVATGSTVTLLYFWVFFNFIGLSSMILKVSDNSYLSMSYDDI